MKAQTVKGGIYTFNVESFRGEKALKKDKFLKKYKGNIVDAEIVWTNIQAKVKELNAKDKAEALKVDVEKVAETKGA